MNKEFSEKVRQLPAKQQIALWVILKKFHKKEGTWFSVAEFAKEMRRYLISNDPEELARIMGGILSSLKRNGMIEQFTGGRKPVWTVVPELHKHASKYEGQIFPVMTYWEKKQQVD